MAAFEIRLLGRDADETAPDGSEVRHLLGLQGGSFAHFSLGARQTSAAVEHRTIDEIWYFVGGHGRMWLACEEREDVFAVHAGVCVTIPCGTRFQFRAEGSESLAAVAVSLPPWPGEGEAMRVDGLWPATVQAGPGGDEHTKRRAD